MAKTSGLCGGMFRWVALLGLEIGRYASLPAGEPCGLALLHRHDRNSSPMHTRGPIAVFDSIDVNLHTSELATGENCSSSEDSSMVFIVTTDTKKVVEFDQTRDILDAWIETQMTTVDPFGVVLWPAAQVLAEMLLAAELSGRRVLEVGAGTGLCSLAAAFRGATVTATDTNPATLQLLELAASRQGLSGVETGLLDITGRADQVELDWDVLVGADCLYNKQIAKGLARLVDRAHSEGVQVMVADSVNIARDEFENELKRLQREYKVETVPLTFTGSAVGVDMDVTRNVSVAVYSLRG